MPVDDAYPAAACAKIAIIVLPLQANRMTKREISLINPEYGTLVRIGLWNADSGSVPDAYI
ncbi:MAG: hypothetical protein J6K41_03945 [Paraprevotella sp.]|nr:hypothetical protein [Paraprevotella sp.]